MREYNQDDLYNYALNYDYELELVVEYYNSLNQTN